MLESSDKTWSTGEGNGKPLQYSCLENPMNRMVSYYRELNRLSQLSKTPPERESHSVVSDSLRPHGLYSLWNSPGQNTGVDSHSLLQGIFPTQGLNPGLLHCRQILYHLSPQGHPSGWNFQISIYGNHHSGLYVI